MIAFLDLFWPTLEGPSADEVRNLHESEIADLEAIRVAKFGKAVDLALDQARRVEFDEEERRKTAETKASNFLLVLAALVPLLTYFESAIWDAKTGTAPKYLTLPALVIAVAYLIGAAFWSFRTVAIGTYHRIGIGDAVTLISDEQSTERLAKSVMMATRRNQEVLNLKVSAAKMAHQFLLRGVLTFCFLLLLQAGFEIAAIVGAWPSNLESSIGARPQVGPAGPQGPRGPRGEKGETGNPGLQIRRVNATCLKGKECIITCDKGEIAIHAYCKTGPVTQISDDKVGCSASLAANELVAFCANQTSGLRPAPE